MYWMTSPWPWPKVTAVALISKNLFVCKIKWEPHIWDHYNTWQLYFPSHGYYLIGFWRNSVENCYFPKFSLKISDVLCKVKHYFGHISGMVGPIDVKQKGSALVGYWVQYMTLTFDLTHDLDLGCFKVKFWNSSISWIVCLIDVKWKGSELIWYCADYMTLPFDHTHNLDLGVSRSESEIALSQEWGGRLTMNEKDASHPFMTMILTCVTMVRWADVPDSDQGDFRRRRAVDISS